MIKDLYDLMDESLRMSTKKESDKTTTRASGADDTARVETTTYRPPTSSFSEQHHSVERVLDETKDNIRRTIEEARRDIPRNTQAINDCQEQYLRFAREFTDEFLNSKGDCKVASINIGSVYRKWIQRILEQVDIST